jgi:hypothetical protein
VLQAQVDDQPTLTHSLVFLKDGQLRVWQAGTGAVSNLVQIDGTLSGIGSIVSYSADSSSSRFAMVDGGAGGAVTVWVYDWPGARLLSEVSIETTSVLDHAISPDGLWMAIIIAEAEAFGVFVYPVDTPQGRLRIGSCSADCSGLKWSRSSLALLWSDSTGIWQGLPGNGIGQEPLLLADPFLRANTGQESIYGAYILGDWSSSGAMMLVSPGGINDSQYAVLDIQTGRVEMLQGPFLYLPAPLLMAWATSDQLLILRTRLDSDQPGAQAEIWVRQPTDSSLMVRSAVTDLADQGAVVPFGPYPLFDGSYFFAMLDFSSPEYHPVDGIYLAGFSPQKLNELPFAPVLDLHWVPDGTGVLVVTRARALYVPTNGSPIYSLAPLLGADTCCYRWVP